MTKKDYILLADAIREHNATIREGGATAFNAGHLATLAKAIQRDNPAFVTGRWTDYIAGKCGRNGGKR
jgi:hypothetical protein